MLYEYNMATRPVQVTIDDDLLAAVDADPEAKERGRSAFIRSALRLYLKAKGRRAIDAQIRAAYGEQADSMVSEIEDLMEQQTWPDD